MQPILVALIAALGGSLTAVITYLLARVKIAEVHVLVNNRAEQQDKRIAQLEALLFDRERDAT